MAIKGFAIQAFLNDLTLLLFFFFSLGKKNQMKFIDTRYIKKNKESFENIFLLYRCKGYQLLEIDSNS